MNTKTDSLGWTIRRALRPLCVGLALALPFVAPAAAATPDLEILPGSIVRVDVLGAQRVIDPHSVATAPSDLSPFDLRSVGVLDIPRVTTAFQGYVDVLQNKAFHLDLDTTNHDATLEFNAWIADFDANLIELPVTLTTGVPIVLDCGGIPVCFPGATAPFCEGREWDPVDGDLKLVGVVLVPFDAQTNVDCAVISFEVEARLLSAAPTGDIDGDLVHDIDDNCPLDGPASQTDSDGDGIGDLCDNCPADPNPYQADLDADGDGNACDPLKVNYQPAGAVMPLGYEKDNGAILVPPAPFGWLGSGTVTTVEREIDPDQRRDTLALTTTERRWEAVQPPGLFDVELQIGDPALPQGPHSAVAEEAVLFDGTQTAAGSHLFSLAEGLPVLDGRLSVDAGGGGGATALNDLFAVESAEQPFVVRAVNFQPAGSTPPPGFEADAGALYDPLLGRGWSTLLDDRDRGFVNDPALATFVFTGPVAEFELDLPADYYLVKVASGDGGFSQGPHRVLVEGQTWFEGVPTGAGDFLEATDRVLVIDRSLSVEIGGSGSNTMLNYVSVISLPADIDGDGINNVPDNCIDTPNPTQQDTDGDRVGDACNEAFDSDGDEWSDARDNCVSISNPSQADGDGDGVGDVCDCAPSDGGAFAVPPPVGVMLVGGGASSSLQWNGQEGVAGDDTVYDVLEQPLSTLRASGTFGAASCLENDRSSSTATDSFIPPSADGRIYLVRGQNACGTGSWGSAAGVVPDPRVALDASGPCP